MYLVLLAAGCVCVCLCAPFCFVLVLYCNFVGVQFAEWPTDAPCFVSCGGVFLREGGEGGVGWDMGAFVVVVVVARENLWRAFTSPWVFLWRVRLHFYAPCYGGGLFFFSRNLFLCVVCLFFVKC